MSGKAQKETTDSRSPVSKPPCQEWPGCRNAAVPTGQDENFQPVWEDERAGACLWDEKTGLCGGRMA